jgi:hypothetical protein
VSGDKFVRLYDHERLHKAKRDAGPELFDALEALTGSFVSGDPKWLNARNLLRDITVRGEQSS